MANETLENLSQEDREFPPSAEFTAQANGKASLYDEAATDFEVMQAFAAIPGSRLLHLHHNKHELTWVKL